MSFLCSNGVHTNSLWKIGLPVNLASPDAVNSVAAFDPASARADLNDLSTLEIEQHARDLAAENAALQAELDGANEVCLPRLHFPFHHSPKSTHLCFSVVLTGGVYEQHRS